MRTAGTRRIKQALLDYSAWRAEVDARAAALTTPGAAAEVARRADDVRQRIERGELWPTTTALASSVISMIIWSERGLYREVHADGSATYV